MPGIDIIKNISKLHQHSLKVTFVRTLPDYFHEFLIFRGWFRTLILIRLENHVHQNHLFN